MNTIRLLLRPRRTTAFVPFCTLVSLLVLVACSADSSSRPDASGRAALDEEPNAPGCADVDPSRCIVPQALLLAGRTSNTACDPNPAYEYRVTVRNWASQPIPNVQVMIRWNDADYPNRTVCFSPISPCVTGMTYVKTWDGYHVLTKSTDASGVARFRLRGSYYGNVVCESGPDLPGGGQVFVCGNEITTTAPWDGFVVATPDLDAASGVDSIDLSLWSVDHFCSDPPGSDNQIYHSRSDYDGDGYVGALDLSIWAGIFFGGGSTISCGGLEPEAVTVEHQSE